MAADEQIELIAHLVEARLGLLYEDARRPLLESRANELLVARSIPSLADLACRLMQQDGNETLWSDLITRIVTRESSWFRQNEHFEVLKNFILPAAASSKGFEENTSVRILSAGCALGQEAYSLAILLAEIADQYEDTRFVIEACDVDEVALATAKSATYAEPELRGLSIGHRAQYFEKVGDRYRVKEPLRGSVRFFQHNLLKPLHTQPYDIILCRNVTIYFDQSTTERVINNLADALHPGGHLFPGHAENLRGLVTPLRPVQFGSIILHRRTRASARLGGGTL